MINMFDERMRSWRTPTIKAGAVRFWFRNTRSWDGEVLPIPKGRVGGL